MRGFGGVVTFEVDADFERTAAFTAVVAFAVNARPAGSAPTNAPVASRTASSRPRMLR